MPQLRTLAFWRPETYTPLAIEPGPAARPPMRKPLQSRVTLLAAMLIAAPAPIAVETSWRRHHTPGVLMWAGSESMKRPSQLSKLSAAVAGSAVQAVAARTRAA